MRKLKSSRYNIEVRHPHTGETILYNSLYGSITVLDAGELPVVRRLLEVGSGAEAEGGELFSALREQRHLVPIGTDEAAIVARRKRLGIRDANRLDVILMPTLDCNFSCTYCYETRLPSRMSATVEADVAQWLEAQIPRFKLTLLHWFGGEPLLAHEQVVRISRRAMNAASTGHVECAIHATTNGYLLTPERLPELVESGVRDFQVTLDGTAETHDRMRMLRGGGGTFQRVFENVVAAARADDRVRVSLRVNFNHTNLATVPVLLRAFPEDVRPRLRPVLEPIFGDCSCSATGNLPAEEISAEMAACYDMAATLGYWVAPASTGTSPGKLVYCYAERENQVIINFNGDVFKCSVCGFETEERVGHIAPGGVLVKDQARWSAWVNDNALFAEACGACQYLPLCMGGCRKERLRRGGTGTYCALIPTNASQILKQVAFGRIDRALSGACGHARATAGVAVDGVAPIHPIVEEADR